MAAKVLDHEAAAHDRRQADGTPERNDLRAMPGVRSAEAVRHAGGATFRRPSGLRVAAKGVRQPTAGLYQIFLTFWAYGMLRYMPPTGISCQFLTASSQPAGHGQSTSQRRWRRAQKNISRRGVEQSLPMALDVCVECGPRLFSQTVSSVPSF